MRQVRISSCAGLRHRVLSWMLCLSLLLAAQGAQLHALGHALEDFAKTGSSQQLPKHPGAHAACVICLAYASVGCASVGQLSSPACVLPHAVQVTSAGADLQRAPLTHYRSRAPPFLL